MRPSQLFDAVIAGDIQSRPSHPTARSFNPEVWERIFDNIGQKTDRDRDLLMAALMIGRQVASLRRETDSKVHVSASANLSRVLAVAESNRQFRRLLVRSQRRIRRTSDEGFLNLSTMADHRYRGAVPDLENTVDGFTEAMVDTLPIWLSRTFEVDAKAVQLSEAPLQRAAMLAALFSLELTYKTLWQRALWLDHCFEVVGDELRFGPTDRQMEELWVCWTTRQSAIHFQYVVPDLYEANLKRQHRQRAKPQRVDYLTVIGLDSRAGQSFKFAFGRPYDDSHGAMRRKMERQVLLNSYVRDFLDVELAVHEGCRLTCNQLLTVWHTVRDAAEAVAGDEKSLRYGDLQTVSLVALTLKRDLLIAALVSCCGMRPELANAAIQFLSTVASDAREMFQKGIWARPLMDVGVSGKLCVVFPALMDSPVRRIELWLERGHLRDSRTESLRGGNFETRARKELAEAIAENPVGLPAQCSRGSIKRRTAADEEIDLVIRLGEEMVVVCELKSFLAPMEPQERFNYLRKLQLASEQAVRKADWLSRNRERLLEVLEGDQDLRALKTFVPLVVLNQGYGLGFKGAKCSIVDLHYLRLYLGDPTYNANAILLPDKLALKDQRFYSDASDAVASFEAAMRDPIVLARYQNRLKWNSFPVPMESGQVIAVSVCVADSHDPEEAELFALAEQLNSDSAFQH